MIWTHAAVSGALELDAIVYPPQELQLTIGRAEQLIEQPKKRWTSNRDLWISHIRLSDKTSRLHPWQGSS